MPHEVSEGRSEAPTRPEMNVSAADLYKDKSPTIATDDIKAENDRYVTKLGFPSAESVLPGTETPASGPLKAGTDTDTPAKEPDAACVARHGDNLQPLVLGVERAGLPRDSRSTELTGFVVNNGDSPGSRTIVTAAHGLVKLPGQDVAMSPYTMLDEGFQWMDNDKDGSLSREEISERLKPLEAMKKGSERPDVYQMKYALENYDAIKATSQRLDPNATGITNDGLARHYMENARVSIKTACGDIPAKLSSGNRDTDVAVLSATGLSPANERLLGENYDVSARTARPGEIVSGVGYPYLDNIPGTSPTVGTGRVLGHGRSPNIPDGGSVIKSDAKITSGMSGGPLVSALGDGREVLGLTHSTSGGMFSGGPGSFVPSASIKEELARARMSYVP